MNKVYHTALLRFLSIVMLLMSVCLLAGCAADPIIVVKKEYLPFTIPASYTQEVTPEPPPSKQLYVNASELQRTELLTQYVLSLYGSLNEANLRLKAVEDYVTLYNKSISETENVK